MPNPRPPRLETRLSSKDSERFRKLQEKRGILATELVREAIVFYLDREENEERLEIESIYSKQLRSSTDRICAMLARSNIGIQSLIEFLAMVDGGAEAMQAAQSKASKRIAKAVEGQKEIGKAMADKVLEQ